MPAGHHAHAISPLSKFTPASRVGMFGVRGKIISTAQGTYTHAHARGGS